MAPPQDAPAVAAPRASAASSPASTSTRAAVLTRALLAVCIGSIAYLFVQLLLYGYGRDQGIYATVAATILRGGMPYRDAWDFKPPGIFVVYALTRAIFGPGQWAIRLVEVLALGSMVWAFTRLSRRVFGDPRIGLVGGTLAVLVHAQLEFWHTAQPESFGGVLTVWAILLAFFEPEPSDPRGRQKQLGAWALAGALYACAGLLKPPLAGGALVSSGFIAGRLFRRGAPLRIWILPIVVMGTAGTAVVGSCAMWFVARGAFSDLYETLFVFTPHYTMLGWEGVSFAGLLYLALEEWLTAYSSINALGFFAAILDRPLAPREREGVLHLLGVIFIQLVGVAMQRKFFPYHYGASLLIGSFLAGLGIYKLWLRAERWGALGVTLFAALTGATLFGRTATRNTATDFFDRCVQRQTWLVGSRADADRKVMDGHLYSVADVNYDADRRVAELLHEKLAPDELAFVWGFEPMIYDMADRRPATRYIYDVPQRVAWFRDTARTRLMQDLESHLPKAIVVEHRDVFPSVTGDAIDSADTLRTFGPLAQLLRDRYTLETRIEDFDVYFAHP
jgi:Dolichyl-phosphate-mannose-protein mannosyltransferase